MKISVSSYSFSQYMRQGKLTQLSAIAAAKEIGLEAIEFTDLTPPEGTTDEEYAAQIKAEADRLGMTINAYTIGANLYQPTPEAEAAEIARLKKKVDVVCLVRNAEKLDSTLKYYFPREHVYFRYETVKGDISYERFGLSEEEYNALASKVDTVIHTAANVSHAGYYADFERTNVFGTQSVIDFCKLSGSVLHHTSTASVHGSGTVEQRDPNTLFDEFKLNIGQKYLQNVYIHSKYKAEERVLLAREEGLLANIYRIGNLTWRVSDGKFQKNAQDNGFLGRCRGLLKVKMYSKELAEYPIDFTPVDECADAYVRLVFGDKVNNVYHLYNPHMFTVDKIGKQFFSNIKMVPREKLEKRLKESIMDKDVAVFSFYNSIASSSRNVPMSNEFTVNELKTLGFKWTKIGLKYLSRMNKIQ